MAGPNQSDVIAELSLAVLDLYRSSGLLRQRIGFGDDGLGLLAKFSGQTVEAVQAQLAGDVEPMPGQALALARAVRLLGAARAGVLAESNGAHR